MIYTCTCNPSLDYFISLSDLKKGELNRSDFELFSAGGKGINVSVILNSLGIRSVALGFLGGFVKDYFLSHLDQYSFLQPQFTNIKGESRIDVRIMDSQETTINAAGPEIMKDEFQKLKNKLRNIYDDDIFVLSGNVQESIEDDMIELVRSLCEEGIKVFLDTNRRIMEECASSGVYFVRISDEDIDGSGEEAIRKAADLFLNKGVQNVLYGQSKERAYFFSGGKVYTSSSLIHDEMEVSYSVSALIGGYLYSLCKGATALESFRFGVSACLVTGHSDVKTTQETMYDIFNRVDIEELS